MNAEPTNRELAAVARRAAEIIQERGKATGTFEDTLGRVCAIGALEEAYCGDEAALSCLIADCANRAAGQSLSLEDWNDSPTTTAVDIAKVFMQVADDLEVTR